MQLRGEPSPWASHTQNKIFLQSSPYWDCPPTLQFPGAPFSSPLARNMSFSWSFSCLCYHHAVLHEQEVHKTLREKRKKKITKIPHSTSRAVLGAELGEKKGQTNRNKHTNKKQRIPPTVSALQGLSFSLLVRN